ncbi:MAG: hypothetical protein M1376_12110 [Planctomycetes bacterium]|nr:hypothetical protein [Planctomycetota bacterium]
MRRYAICLSVLLQLPLWAAAPVSISLPVANASFEAPVVDPNGFGAWPVADGWLEVDLDTAASSNTGVFLNTPADSPDRMVNAEGKQLAFLGSQRGNALEQDLGSSYRVGCDYRLTVGVGISARFPPSMASPADTLELVLYYLDGNEPKDIVHQTVEPNGLSSTQLQDFTAVLPTVRAEDAWAGKTIGVALRAAGNPGGFWDLDNVRLTESMPVSIPVENASFESPAVDPNGFGAWPFMEGWLELDLDAAASSNTGVFLNTPVGNPDCLVNADANQLAFLGSQQGNALEQDLAAVYQIGCSYRLTVAVGVSARFPPSPIVPVDTMEIVLYYRADDKPVDIVHQTVEAKGLSSTQLHEFSVYLAMVQASDAWAGKNIGVAIRAAGAAGGFWDLDNIRLAESPLAVPPAPRTQE